RRNRLEHQRLSDIIYVTYNLRLQSRLHRKKRNYDPIDIQSIDTVDFWVMADEDDLEFTNGDVEGTESLIYIDNAMPSYPNDGGDMEVEVDMPDVVIESSNTSLDAAKIQENISNVKCPEPKCRGILEPQNCMSIIPKEVFERWENALCENLVLATSKKFYCSFKDCSTMLVNDDGNEVVTCSECPNCHRLFCAQGKVAWHGGMECGEFMGLNENEREKEDLMVMNLAKANKRWR
ncbi:hypothetical protein S83_037893, partial [Arachis hypogaea]